MLKTIKGPRDPLFRAEMKRLGVKKIETEYLVYARIKGLNDAFHGKKTSLTVQDLNEHTEFIMLDRSAEVR